MSCSAPAQFGYYFPGQVPNLRFQPNRARIRAAISLGVRRIDNCQSLRWPGCEAGNVKPTTDSGMNPSHYFPSVGLPCVTVAGPVDGRGMICVTAVVPSGLSLQPRCQRDPVTRDQHVSMSARERRSTQPGGNPSPAISPRSLIAIVSTNCKLELGGINVFKSTIEPFSHRNERWCRKRRRTNSPRPDL